MFNIRKPALGRSVEKFESIVGPTLQIHGDLVITRSLRIDGTVQGSILQAEGSASTVAIGPEATVEGNVTVQDLIVSGCIKGHIHCPGRVELMDSARIEGNITYGSIGVALGACIMGQLRQINELSQHEAMNAITKAAKHVTSHA